jgi:hypothetical protein
MFRSPAERRAFAWILGVGALVAALRVFLSTPPRSPQSAQLASGLWIDSRLCWIAGILLSLDGALVILSRRPPVAQWCQALLLGSFLLVVGWALLLCFGGALFADRPGKGAEIVLQVGTFFGLLGAAQWFSMKAAGELI